MDEFQIKQDEIALKTINLNVVYHNGKQEFFNGNISLKKHCITSLIGASGCGKSTFLRSLNRMNDRIAKVSGKIIYQDVDINAPNINVYAVRKNIGMVFQKPNLFNKSIKENITYALKVRGEKKDLDEIVEKSLKEVALWDEVKDKLNLNANELSGGQQQRLCIARSLATRPDIILMDEPTSALDPLSTKMIETTIKKLALNYTIIIVTHNMKQAKRVSDNTAFIHLGKIIEYNTTRNIFGNPHSQLTKDYIMGNFG